LGDRLTVVASELLPAVTKVAGLDGENVLAKAKGEALAGLEYRRPLPGTQGETGRLVLADYVTLEDGTGLVHTAPGHGVEDFETGHREGAPIYCPVRGDGTYDDTVPEPLRGKTVWEANPEIIEMMRASGNLYHYNDFMHSYPHDWRSKTPVIFRCTEQWFIAVDRPTRRDGESLRQLALTATESQVRFVPDWGRNRMRGMLESRPDWCVSRQRSWGLPIPAFRTADGRVLLTAATVRAVGDVFGREGSDAWFTRSAADLLADWDRAADPDWQGDVDLERLEKMYDIFDVWLESGSSWNAVMRARGLGYPTDLYLEGSDQHRGWFQLSLLPALGVTGQSPFKTLMTHGFMVDKNGHKMSKSVGNTLNVDDLLKNYGADVMRWWVGSLAFENDIKIDLSFFDLAGESYRKVRNTLRFLLSNLDDFDPASGVEEPAPASLDAWILARAADLRTRVVDALLNYQFRQAHLLLFDFCNDTLSAFYLDAVKDRLYCDAPDSPRRRSAQVAMFRVADLLTHLLAPMIPHTADEAHRALVGEDAPSVHLGTFPDVDAPVLDDGWVHVLAVRDAALKALEAAKGDGVESPRDAGLRIADPDGVLSRFADDLTDVLGVSRVELVEDGPIEVVDLRDAPRCERSWRRDDTVRERADGGWLSDRDAAAVGLA
ncbi:MAG: class I tRNA ligase family protein, partial [Acidobacteriota bacterium]